LGESDAEKKLRGLVELVVRLAARNGGRVTVKILQKANSRKYRTRDAAGADLGRLAEVGLGRWEDGPEPECGGKRQRFFVPTVATADEDANPDPDPDPTSDDSDHRPGEDERPTGRSPPDDRPDPHDDRPGGGNGSPVPTATSAMPSGETPAPADSRSSESSEVVPDRAPGGVVPRRLHPGAAGRRAIPGAD